jgi:hypothetical protein
MTPTMTPDADRTHDADTVSAYVEYARNAAGRGDWNTALEHWQDCFERFPDQVKPQWYISRATAQLKTGQHDAAEKSLRRYAAGGITGATAAILIRSLYRSHLHEDLVSQYRSGVLRGGSGGVADLLIVRSLLKCRLIAEARAAYEMFAPQLDTATDLAACMPDIAGLFPKRQRPRHWHALESRAAGAAAEAQHAAEQAGFNAVRMRCLLALRDYQAFGDCMDACAGLSALPDEWPQLLQLRERLPGRNVPDTGRGKVFGIGLSKTATNSLNAALLDLGYSAIHFTNPFTKELICDDDFALFDAFTDIPVSCRFEELFHRFPDARFIYTTRDLDDWRRSFLEHHRWANNVGGFDAFRAMIDHPDGCKFGDEYKQMHKALYTSHPDLKAAYRYHDRRVLDFFSGRRSDQLLEFSVFAGDGWEKLCRFLGEPVPPCAFPWNNKAHKL